jgi:transcriptional pleiotropic regulator of transition state genes
MQGVGSAAMAANVDFSTPQRAEAVGTARRIDQLGRVVVPAELRKLTGIQPGDLLDFRAEGGAIVMSKLAQECVLCGRLERLVSVHDKHFCEPCLTELRHSPECALCGTLGPLVERHGKHICVECLQELNVA